MWQIRLRPRQPWLGDDRARTRRHGRDVRGWPLQPVAPGLLHRRRGDWARKTPWSRPQHPAREPPAPTTRSTALGSTNPFHDFTAARAPCADNDLSAPATRVTRHPCTHPAPTGSRRHDDQTVNRSHDAQTQVMVRASAASRVVAAVHALLQERPILAGKFLVGSAYLKPSPGAASRGICGGKNRAVARVGAKPDFPHTKRALHWDGLLPHEISFDLEINDLSGNLGWQEMPRNITLCSAPEARDQLRAVDS